MKGDERGFFKISELIIHQTFDDFDDFIHNGGVFETLGVRVKILAL